MKNLNSTRAGGICVHDGRILLMHTINLEKIEAEQRYYAIPGGTVESNEEPKETVVREMKEETNIKVRVGDLFFEMEDKNKKGGNRKHYYYLCEYVSGEPGLPEDSEEAVEMRDGVQFYEPMWVGLEDFKSVPLFPAQIKNKIVEEFC